MTDLLFYDGTCGLCHHAVKFALARDREGTRFRYAPLQGPTFERTFPPADRARLPDSIVLKTADGRTLVRSDAVLRIAERIGGGWGTLARLLQLLPRWLLDFAYDGVAKVRKRLFATPEGSCPLLPPELRGRFLP
jgi:predicted DCC family thiol-disulfide oxidoreductase YuxK